MQASIITKGKIKGGFSKKEPINTARIHRHSLIVEIFTRHSLLGFFEKMRGYDDEVARDFSLSLIPLTRTHATPVVKSISVEITTEVISRITSLPFGLPWRKEYKGNNTLAKKKFFLEGEEEMGPEEKYFHTLGMKLATISLNIYHVKGYTMWYMGTISRFSKN